MQLAIKNTEILKLRKNAQEHASYAAKESSKFKEAKEVVKSITDQLKEIIEKLPSEVSESETLKAINTQAEAFLKTHGTNEASMESSNDQRMEYSVDTTAVPSNYSSENESRSSEASAVRGGVEKEITEQFEPGVYITYVNHRNGGKIFRRVRFSKRRFDETQAEEWWSKNKDRVLKRYSPHATKSASSTASSLTQPPPPPVVDETTEAAPPP
ncbi:hypothetical protein GOBAR_DD00668 [Gossypium barbadense]|nr:hypothetical protein GOBAR_DD00668 [Gossypium barbadense]